MKKVNENVKDYIEKMGKTTKWVASRSGIEEEALLSFLNGESNEEIVEALEKLYGAKNGFFEEGKYVSPKSLNQIWEESKKEQEERMEKYNKKREKIDKEIEKIINSFEGAYFDKKENELVFNKDNTLFLKLEELAHMENIYSVETFKLMVAKLMFRTIAKSPNGEKYLKETNGYFGSNIKIEELKEYYQRVPNQKEWRTEEELNYLIESNFDFSFEKIYM